MKIIEQSIYEQKARFDYYKNFDCRVFNISASVDITNFYDFINKHNKPLSFSLVYAVSRVANDINQFRQRVIDDETIIEHEIVHPAFLINNVKDNFNFYKSDYKENYFRFVEYTLTNNELNKNEQSNINNDNDLIFVSFIPLGSFTNITLPYDKSNCCPHISIGKYFKNNERIIIPISVQVDYSLINENDISIFFEKLQELLLYPENYIDNVLDKQDKNEQNNYDTRIIRASSLSQRKNSSFPYEINF